MFSDITFYLTQQPSYKEAAVIPVACALVVQELSHPVTLASQSALQHCKSSAVLQNNSHVTAYQIGFTILHSGCTQLPLTGIRV